MRDFKSLKFVIAFAGAASAAFVVSASTSPSPITSFTSLIASPAQAADRDDRKDNDDSHGKRKGYYGHHAPSHVAPVINGTILSANDQTARIRLDNGQIINIDPSRTELNVGQHYTLRGCYQNGMFINHCKP